MEKGTICSFDVKKGAKGAQAINVVTVDEVRNVAKQSAFLKIGNTSIKLSNIKQYGLSKKVKFKIPVFEPYEEETKLWVFDFGKTTIYRQTGDYRFIDKDYLPYAYGIPDKWIHIPFYVKKKSGIIEQDGYLPEKKVLIKTGHEPWNKEGEIEEIECAYLYITTYQGDNYCFYDFEHDVYAIKHDLDLRLA